MQAHSGQTPDLYFEDISYSILLLFEQVDVDRSTHRIPNDERLDTAALLWTTFFRMLQLRDWYASLFVAQLSVL